MTGSQISHPPQDAGEMLQVKDMEFELVRPNFAHFQGAAARTSEDFGVPGRESFIDLRRDGYLRPESPAVSVSSGGHSPDMWPQPPMTDSESSMESTSVDGCRTRYQKIFPGSAAFSRNTGTVVGSPPGVFEYGSRYSVFHG